MRGADCWTDHNLIRSKISMQLRPQQRRQAPVKRLNINALKEPTVTEKLRETIAKELSETPGSNSIDTDCQQFLSTVMKSATDVLGYTKRRHQDWFDENTPEIHNLLNEKRKIHDALLKHPWSHDLRNRYKNIRSETQRLLRIMENEWWLRKAQEIQGYADTNNTHGFYDAIKTVYGPQKRNITSVKSADGSILYKEKDQIIARWAEHFEHLLNHENPNDPTVLHNLPDLPPIEVLDQPPQFSEVLNAIKGLKNNKSPGPDGIPAEVFKEGGYILKLRIHEIITRIWESGTVPQSLKDGTIITIFKKKGDRSVCGNSRAITLLAVAGKILTRIMLESIIDHLSESTLPETKCGFRKERSTTDMIFVARQLQEKSREQNSDIFIAFIDLAKAFDTVCRSILWQLLEKLGIPPKFLTVLKQFHEGMQVRVQVGGTLSDPFSINIGVKQGCVLAPVIFNIFLMAVIHLCHNALGEEAGINISYRLDGSLFNLRRLQAHTKVALTNIRELQYADDCAVVAQDRETLQRLLDVLNTTYSALGLRVNTQKTVVIAQQIHPPAEQQSFTINGEEI